MATNTPRAVLVTRQTDYEALLARHATRDQARFFLASHGQDIESLQARHEGFHAALHRVRSAIPIDWRTSQLRRDDLDRFLFGPEDVIVVVGQDGLVANVAKYLDGQPVLGINPEPDINPGVLVPLAPAAVAGLLIPASRGRAAIESRTMAEAALDDGQTLLALNEIFVGHRSHQSARYALKHSAREEEQSSSGLIVSTGTGATGWAKSVMLSRKIELNLQPTDRSLAFFVREPWPSLATGTSLSVGTLEGGEQLEILSHMQSGGVIFADGIEQDHLIFDWGKSAEIHVAARQLNLVQP
jgi:NAD kinase